MSTAPLRASGSAAAPGLAGNRGGSDEPHSYQGRVLEEGRIGRDGQDWRASEDDDEGHGDAVEDGHGLREHLGSSVIYAALQRVSVRSPVPRCAYRYGRIAFRSNEHRVTILNFRNATSSAEAMVPARSMRSESVSLILEPGTRLVVATHNPGKARELAEILEGRFTLVAAGELGLPEPEETEATFVGNAMLKARAAADASGLIALAEGGVRR